MNAQAIKHSKYGCAFRHYLCSIGIYRCFTSSEIPINSQNQVTHEFLLLVPLVCILKTQTSIAFN